MADKITGRDAFSSTRASPAAIVEERAPADPSEQSEAPRLVHEVQLTDLDPPDLYRLAWAYTAAWHGGAHKLLSRHILLRPFVKNERIANKYRIFSPSNTAIPVVQFIQFHKVRPRFRFMSIPPLSLSLLPADERHRAVRDVLLLDGITKCLTSKQHQAKSQLLIHTLAALATIPHYDPSLYEDTAYQAMLRREGQDSAPSEPPLSVEDAVTAILAFSRVRHRGRNGRLFLTEMMRMVEQVGAESLL